MALSNSDRDYLRRLNENNGKLDNTHQMTWQRRQEVEAEQSWIKSGKK